MNPYDESDLWNSTHNKKENFRDALIFLIIILVLIIINLLII